MNICKITFKEIKHGYIANRDFRKSWGIFGESTGFFLGVYKSFLNI